MLAIELGKSNKCLDERSERQRMKLSGKAKNTTVGGNLENAIGTIRRLILVIGWVVMICRIMLTGRLNLVKKVMHPMGSGIGEKE